MVEDLLVKALNRALELGASYAEVRYQRDVTSSLMLRNGAVVAVGEDLSEGVGIRVLVNGSLGFAATNVLDTEHVLRAAKIAVDRAKASSKFMKRPITFSEDRVGRATYEVVPRRKLEDLSVKDRVSIGQDVHKVITSSVKEAKVAVTTYSFEAHTQEKVVVNSDGAYVRSKIPRLLITVSYVLLSPNKGSIQRFTEFGAAGGAELINEWRISDKLSEEVPRIEKVLIKGSEPPKDEVDVVVGPEVMGLLVHESAGHPMEADRILGREAAQAGESFVKPEMIGKYRIGTEYVTIIDDPTIPGSYGYFLFDDEGVPARPKYLYLNGVINEPLHNRQTAKLFGTRSNGSARSMNYASEPIIRMSNTYFKPGDMSFEELIEDIKLGVYIRSYMEWNIDDSRWNQRYVGLEAYIVKDGEVREDMPVRNPVLEVTTKGFYSRVVGADRNLEFYPGTCGKGEPAQGVPVWFGGPNVRISRIKLGVIAG